MSHEQTDVKSGGVAQFFVEHREVSWMALLAVIAWGWLAYGKLAQQEDPKIPERTARVLTHFPGASAGKVEQLVTKKLEKKISELESIDEIKSQSRAGVSVVTVSLQPASEGVIAQEWDKLRAKLKEATLPEGCEPPALDSDYQNTIALLFAITSPSISEAACQVRAKLVRERLGELRQKDPATNSRAAVVAFFPAGIAESYRSSVVQQFQNALAAERLGWDIRIHQSPSFILADFATKAGKAQIQALINEFMRRQAGTDGELHPDFKPPIILLGSEDPLPYIRAQGAARYSYRQLELMAENMEDELKQIHSVGRVRQIGTVREMVYLLFSTASVNGYKISSDEVMKYIAERNALIPGGMLRTEGQNFLVQLSGEFEKEDALLGAVVGVSQEGMPIYLRDIFEVRRGYENPIPFNVNVLKRSAPNGPLQEHRSVLVAVEMKDGNIISQFNEEVCAALHAWQSRLPDGVELVTVSNQPKAVATRLQHFSRCFLEAVCIVIIVALFLMDWRSALVVAIAIPLTVALTLAGMWIFGIAFHQISIAALIIALGMLVDDPVVASDGINRELAAGADRRRAAWLGPFKLRRAILFGTIINIVAFLPLVLLPGDKGAFIFALPMVVTLALIASRLVSLTFVPLVGYYLLRGQKGLEAGNEVRSFILFKAVDKLLLAVLPKYKMLLRSALDHPWRAMSLSYGALLLSLGLVGVIPQQFFPPAERNQLLVDIELPETASPLQMRNTCHEVARLLETHEEVANAAIFYGGSAPRFYYNVSPREPGSYLAQVLVNTRSDQDVPALLVKLRSELDREIAGARCVVKQLEQGPPVDAPIQIRVSGDDLDVIRALADRVAQAIRTANGYRVHDDLGRRLPTLEINIDQERANTLGVGNAQIGRLTQAAFSGLKVTELREGDHLVPVMIRLRVEERNEAEKIRSLYVESPRYRNQLIPMNSFANLEIKPEFASIPHFNQLRAVTVKSYAAFGELPSQVLAGARGALEKIEVPTGYKIEFAGEAKELKQNQGEMLGVMQISLALITLAMVLQFNSVFKSLVVMLTVPLGLIGALLGLTLTGTPMGFMALLGVVSLAGVVVSHIIVLSDFIEDARAHGMELKEALLQAGLVRLRAVLVTVLATVGGLVPLFLTGGALWKPLTAVHIFGLLFATLLTLVLLPALYFVFCVKFKLIK